MLAKRTVRPTAIVPLGSVVSPVVVRPITVRRLRSGPVWYVPHPAVVRSPLLPAAPELTFSLIRVSPNRLRLITTLDGPVGPDHLDTITLTVRDEADGIIQPDRIMTKQ